MGGGETKYVTQHVSASVPSHAFPEAAQDVKLSLGTGRCHSPPPGCAKICADVVSLISPPCWELGTV